MLSHGSSVTERYGVLVVKKRKNEVFRRPLAGLELVFLQGNGMSVSLALALGCAKHDVPLVVAPPVGGPVAILNPLTSTRSHLRGRQVLRRNDLDVIRSGLRMLGAKIRNQAAVLRYFAKYRRLTAPDLHKDLVTASATLRGLAGQLEALDPGTAGVRASAMGLEGHSAAIYWAHLARLMPGDLGFSGRSTRDATDPVNQMINYAYGMLYGEVWRALAKVGLDPYFGLMHGSERDQGSLVFDLIEEFRAPFADRVVLGMLGRGLKLDVAGPRKSAGGES